MTWKHKLSKRLSLLKDALMLVVVLAACGHSTPTGTAADADAASRARSRPVASVTVSSPADSLLVESTMQFTLVLRDPYGRIVNERPVTWSSSDTSRATVTQTGLVRGRGPGAVTITAVSEEKRGSDGLLVVAPPPPPPAPMPVASVSVTPSTTSLLVGASVQLAAVTRDSAGGTLTGRTVTWFSSNGAVATVSASGAVTGVAAGLATVTATSEGRTGTTAVTVTPPVPAPVASVTVSPASATVDAGATAQLSATTRDADGQILTGRQVTWSTSNAAVATVSALGVVTGIAAGSATITATSEGRSAAAAVTVAAPAPPPAVQAPNIVNNASFESGWDGFTSSDGASAPGGVVRATDQAYAGTFAARALWGPNASDVGTASFWKYSFAGQDRVWVRFYFRLAASWSITTVQKFCILRQGGGGTQFGGLELSNAGLTFSFFQEAGAVQATIRPKATISPDAWHSIEVEYRRNGTTNPQAVFWYDGVQITHANGADAAGHGLTWINNVLDAGGRGSSAQIGMMQLLGTRNGGNTGSGTIWLDRVAVSSAGRIGQ